MTLTSLRPARRALLLLLGACAASSLLAGCAGAQRSWAPTPEARWINWSRPVFSEINRETMFSLAHSPDHATLVIEQTHEGDRYLRNPRTWLITVPQTPSMLTPIELGENLPDNCWVLTRVGADPVAEFPARGRISVLSSDSESMTAQINISATMGPNTAGNAAPPEFSLDARMVFVRVTPRTDQPNHPATTSGVPLIKPKPETPLRQ